MWHVDVCTSYAIRPSVFLLVSDGRSKLINIQLVNSHLETLRLTRFFFFRKDITIEKISWIRTMKSMNGQWNRPMAVQMCLTASLKFSTNFELASCFDKPIRTLNTLFDQLLLEITFTCYGPMAVQRCLTVSFKFALVSCFETPKWTQNTLFDLGWNDMTLIHSLI